MVFEQVAWDGWGNGVVGNTWNVTEDCGAMKTNVKEENGWKLGQREASVQRYKEKRQSRLFAKKIRYEVRKLNAEKRPRMKVLFPSLIFTVDCFCSIAMPLHDARNVRNLLILNSCKMDFFWVHFAGTICEEGMRSAEGLGRLVIRVL